jgi:tRNA U34 2-thiouridine synthase MnmA/TrmU
MQKNKNCVKIITNQKIWAPASGQAVVFYKKDEILGGGIII